MNRFLQGVPKFFQVASLGFFIALFGAFIGLLIDYGPDNILSYFVFGVVAIGVAVGFVGIMMGLFNFISQVSQYQENSSGQTVDRKKYARSKQPWE